MRRPLRYVLCVLRDAGVDVDCIQQAGKHTEIVLRSGDRYRLPRGNHASRRLEHGLRSYVRRLRSEAP